VDSAMPSRPPGTAPLHLLLDGERADHSRGAVPGDAAEEGVLPGLEVDLLRLAAPAVGLELEAGVGAVEHEVVDVAVDDEVDRGDPRLGGDGVRLEVEVAGVHGDRLGRGALGL